MTAGRRWTVRDRYGNEIYLTHERVKYGYDKANL